MKRPKFTDGRGTYHSSEKSREPGYLARRFKAIERLQRMRAKKHNVTPIKKAANG
jgi:hypothetical protein